MDNSALNNKQPRGSLSGNFIYTYHLPYGIRRNICNLLDADQSWRTLGGQYMGLDATQLTLIGQAYLRNGSPTEELLNKLDSANLRILEFCTYLNQMNHCRALEILRPFLSSQQDYQDSLMTPSRNINHAKQNANETLNTPTPSFASIEEQAIRPLCALVYEPEPIDTDQRINFLNYDVTQENHPERPARTNRNQINNPPRQFEPLQQNHVVPPANRCHKAHQDDQQQNQDRAQRDAINHRAVGTNDPGEEIVRLACANNRKRTSISDQEVVNQLRLIMQINYNELKQASNDFSDSNILGNGGFASVYRGCWKGTDVAIKRLHCNLMDQALNELTILNSYRIDNILPIYGISIDGPEACLVYQFMSNGSLEDRLSCKNDTEPLTWNQRALIGEGVAKGLYYLHTLRDKPLVHGDVKSANVLLDSQFVPKLGDFGLARQVFKGKNFQTELCTHCTVSSIHGTSVYLPPEYLRHKILSPAVDVYSYGIVLLEMATGKRAYDGKRLLIDLVEDETKSISFGTQQQQHIFCANLRDHRISSDTQNDQRIWFDLLIRLGIDCAHKIKKKRPDIGQVLNHFANFRSSADTAGMLSPDLLNIKNSFFVSNGTSPAAGSTARTLTPDLTATIDNKNNAFQFQHNANEKMPKLQEYPKTINRANSALMSVEEEQFQPHYQGTLEQQQYEQFLDQTYEHQQNLHQHQLQQQQLQMQQQVVENEPVEAMIPLLTELGIAQPD